MAAASVVILSALIFFGLNLAISSDAVDLMLAEYGGNEQIADQLRNQMGISGSLPQQYLEWISGVATGDLGRSYYNNRPVIDELSYRIPATLELSAGALAVTIFLGIPIGLLSSIRQDRPIDYVFRGGAILLYAIPGFWAATLVIVFGSSWFGWAPTLDYYPLWENPMQNIRSLLPAALLLSLSPLGAMIRLVRTQALEVSRQDYVRTAWAKGAPPRQVYARHVLRNSMLPVVTSIAILMPSLASGTVIFETIFSIPGVGSYLLESLARLDYPVVLAVNLFIAIVMVVSFLIMDLSYALLDPRIRRS